MNCACAAFPTLVAFGSRHNYVKTSYGKADCRTTLFECWRRALQKKQRLLTLTTLVNVRIPTRRPRLNLCLNCRAAPSLAPHLLAAAKEHDRIPQISAAFATERLSEELVTINNYSLRQAKNQLLDRLAAFSSGPPSVY